MNRCAACLLLLIMISAATAMTATAAEPAGDRLRWFREAKLGIFIHWGIYAVDGIDESWSFYNGHVTHDKYLEQLAGFTAARYDPAAWAELIAASGARYAVLTAKHHDGVGE